MKTFFTSLVLLTFSLITTGSNWTEVTLEGSNRIRSMCAFSKTEALVVGFDSLVFKTYDGGRTWHKIAMKPFYPIGTVGFDFYDATAAGDAVMVAVGKEGNYPGFVMKSTDKGESWTPILATSFANDLGMDKNPAYEGASKHRSYNVEMIDDTTAFATLNWKDSTNTTRNGMFKTIDGGISWNYCNTPTMTSSALDAEISFIGNTGYFAGTASSYVFKTTDGGITWTDYTDDDKYSFIWGMKMLAENEVYILSSSELFGYSNFDLGIAVKDTFPKSSSYDFLVLDKDRVITFHKHDNIWATSNASAGTNVEWTMVGNGSLSTIRKCDMVFNDTIYGLGDGVIFKLAVSDAFKTTTALKPTMEDHSLSINQNDNEIIIHAEHSIARCTIYSISGQIIHSATPHDTNYSVNTANLMHGIYLVRAESNRKTTTKRLIIK